MYYHSFFLSCLCIDNLIFVFRIAYLHAGVVRSGKTQWRYLYAQLKATTRHGNTGNILLNFACVCMCLCGCSFTHRSINHKLIYFKEFYKIIYWWCHSNLFCSFYTLNCTYKYFFCQQLHWRFWFLLICYLSFKPRYLVTLAEGSRELF